MRKYSNAASANCSPAKDDGAPVSMASGSKNAGTPARPRHGSAHVVDLRVFDEADAADDRPSADLRAGVIARPNRFLGAGGDEHAVVDEEVEVRQQLIEPRARVLAERTAAFDDGVYDRARLA